jgi:hypothetical protein
MQLEFKVTYTDERVETYRVRPIHLVEMEDNGVEMGENATSSFQMAHAASGDDGDFRVWLATVEDIDTIGAKADAEADEAEASASSNGTAAKKESEKRPTRVA